MKRIFIYLMLIALVPLTGACEDSLGVDKNVHILDKVVNTGKQFIVIDSANFGFEINGYTDIAFEEDGIVWMISGSNLVRFDYSSKQIFGIFEYFNCIDVDSKGNKWLGYQKGILKFYNGNFIEYDTNNSNLKYDNISEIAIDRQDNIWACGFNTNYINDSISFETGEILKYDGLDKWEYYNFIEETEPNLQFISCISIDNNNDVWISREDGLGLMSQLSKFDQNIENFQHYTNTYQSITKIIFDNYDNMWIKVSSGELGSGLSDLVKKEFNNFKVVYSGIYDFTLDNSNIWIASIDSGITKYDGVTLTSFNKNNGGFFTNLISKITRDKYGNLLVCVPDTNNPYNWKVALFREDGVLLPEEAVSVMEKRQQKIGKASIFPNPFSQSTIINYELREAGYVTLKVFDHMGNEVAALVDGFMPAGRHEARFDGGGLAPGVYFYVLRAGSDVVTEKMILAR